MPKFMFAKFDEGEAGGRLFTVEAENVEQADQLVARAVCGRDSLQEAADFEGHGGFYVPFFVVNAPLPEREE